MKVKASVHLLYKHSLSVGRTTHKIAPFPWRSVSPSNTWCPFESLTHTAFDRFISFCRTHERDQQTDTLIDHTTPSVAIARI